MKVLHILDHSYPYFSGYTFRSKYILHFQKQMGIIPVVLTSPKHEYEQLVEEFEGITYYRTKPPASWIQKYSYISEIYLMKGLFHRIIEVAKKEKIDLIHAHSPSLNGIPGKIAAKKLGIPMTYEIRAFWEDAAVDHGTSGENSLRYRITRLLETVLVRCTNPVITICNGLRDDLAARNINPDKIFVIPNGIDSRKFSPKPKNQDIIKEHGLENNVVIGYLGSLYKYEGVEDLITAFNKIHTKRPQTKLLIVGGGNEDKNLRSQVPPHMDRHIIFIGKVPHESVPDYYSVMDILVYPRRKMRLTELVTPLKPLEALAMHKIVIGSDVGGIKELIGGGRTGALFRAGNIDDLVKKTITVIDEMNEGSKGDDAEMTEFIYKKDWENVVKGYIGVYGEHVPNIESLLSMKQ